MRKKIIFVNIHFEDKYENVTHERFKSLELNTFFSPTDNIESQVQMLCEKSFVGSNSQFRMNINISSKFLPDVP